MTGFDIGLYCRRGRFQKRLVGWMATTLVVASVGWAAVAGGHRLKPEVVPEPRAVVAPIAWMLVGLVVRRLVTCSRAGRRYANQLDYVVGQVLRVPAWHDAKVAARLSASPVTTRPPEADRPRAFVPSDAPGRIPAPPAVRVVATEPALPAGVTRAQLESLLRRFPAGPEPVPAVEGPPGPTVEPPFPVYPDPNELGISKQERRRRIRENGEKARQARRPGNNGDGNDDQVPAGRGAGWDDAD